MFQLRIPLGGGAEKVVSYGMDQLHLCWSLFWCKKGMDVMVVMRKERRRFIPGGTDQ